MNTSCTRSWESESPCLLPALAHLPARVSADGGVTRASIQNSSDLPEARARQVLKQLRDGFRPGWKWEVFGFLNGFTCPEVFIKY